MRKEDKAIIIEKIGETLKEYSCFYLTDTTSMDAEQTRRSVALASTRK